MQSKLLESVDERRSQFKKKVQKILEDSIKYSPITPRTPRKTGSDSSGPKYKKVDNFINNLLGDQMVLENWVSSMNDG